MIKTSKLTNNKLDIFVSEIQKDIYKIFDELNIAFERVDCEPAITMEDCLAIDNALGVKTVKTILLNNQQKTKFYVCVLPGDKRFNCKAFSKALGISRTSFSNEENFHKYLHAEIGGTSVLSILYDKDIELTIAFDKEAVNTEFIGLNDCTTISYLKLLTLDLLNKYLPYTKHDFQIIEI